MEEVRQRIQVCMWCAHCGWLEESASKRDGADTWIPGMDGVCPSHQERGGLGTGGARWMDGEQKRGRIRIRRRDARVVLVAAAAAAGDCWRVVAAPHLLTRVLVMEPFRCVGVCLFCVATGTCRQARPPSAGHRVPEGCDRPLHVHGCVCLRAVPGGDGGVLALTATSSRTPLSSGIP